MKRMHFWLLILSNLEFSGRRANSLLSRQDHQNVGGLPGRQRP